MTDKPNVHDELILHDVVVAHACLAPVQQLVADRRAVYRMAASLVHAEIAGSLTDDVLDHPVTRFRIGQVIGGRGTASADLTTAQSLAGKRHPGGKDQPFAVVGAENAEALLREALISVSSEAGLKDAPHGLVRLLNDSDDERFDGAVDKFAAGLRLAEQSAPELTADLIAHVALVGILDPERSGSVMSASSRAFPGLILLRAGSPIDIAEAIIHEAAHQKLFDLAITRDLLSLLSDSGPMFKPSWRESEWPMEQALAACHAYACLAQFAHALKDVPRDHASAYSVLPFASQRAKEIGRWLLARGDYLCADSYRLLGGLFGQPPRIEPLVDRLPTGMIYRTEQCEVLSTASSRYLVGLRGDPPQLFWLDNDASVVFDILQSASSLSDELVVAEFRRRRVADASESLSRVSGALETLVLSGLAAVT